MGSLDASDGGGCQEGGSMPSGDIAPRKEPWWSRGSAPLPVAAAVASEAEALGRFTK